MKRRDLMKRLAKIAKQAGATMVTVEGGSHTKVIIGTRVTVVPRHNEINELTARAILEQIGGDQ